MLPLFVWQISSVFNYLIRFILFTFLFFPNLIGTRIENSSKSLHHCLLNIKQFISFWSSNFSKFDKKKKVSENLPPGKCLFPRALPDCLLPAQARECEQETLNFFSFSNFSVPFNAKKKKGFHEKLQIFIYKFFRRK